MVDLITLTGAAFMDEWLRSEREAHRRLLYQLKREFTELRRENSSRSYRPVGIQVSRERSSRVPTG